MTDETLNIAAAADMLMQGADEAPAEIEEAPVEDQAEGVDDEGIPVGELAAVLGLTEDDISVSDDGSPLIAAKVKGERVDVSLDEMRRSYQMQAVQDTKSQELNQQREQFFAAQAQQAQEFEQRGATLDATYTQLQQAVAEQYQSPQIEALRHTDPAQWAATMEDGRRQIQRLETLKQQAAQQVEQQRQQAQQAQMQAYQPHINRLTQMLDSDTSLPDVRTDKGRDSVVKTMLDAGYNQQELGAMAADPRLALLAIKAARLDQMLATAKPEAKKVRLQKRVLKPGSKQQASKQDGPAKARAFKSLKSSGSLDDAVAALMGS